MQNSPQSIFPGFPETLEKSYWQFPSIINNYVHSLTGGEFKVLWYILRHTFGWQKEQDKLSINQICNGIARRDGTILDKGTGLSRKWVITALSSLESKGFVTIKREPGKVSLISPKITSNTKYTGVESTPQPVEQSTLVTGVESTPTIDINTIDITNRKEIYKEKNILLKKKSYSLLEEIKDIDLIEVAARYQVPIAFVRSKLEDMYLWVGEKEGRGKNRNWKLTLMNWVKRDMLKIQEKRIIRPERRTIDATNIK